ncbi:hypothetical protein MTO96_020390 [Rhipicephalus appendiculatus]
MLCKYQSTMTLSHRHIEIDGHLLADKMLIPGMAAVPGISLLIGADQLWQLMSGETKRYHGQKSLVVMDSAFGCMLQGPLSFDTSLELGLNVCVLGLSTSADSTGEVIWRFRRWEIIGIMPADNSTPTKETKAKLERLEQEVLYEIKQEIQETHAEVDLCRQAGQDLMPDRAEVKRHIADLDTAGENVTTRYAKRELNLMNALDKTIGFCDTLQNSLESLDKAEQKFGSLVPVAADIDAVKAQIGRLKDFKREVDRHIVEMKSLTRQATELSKQTSSKQACALQQPFDEINRRWTALV